jgi:BirA family biotin operon repressor/biotin-[acetyl-CoA-carboxylase] ligase
LTFAGTAEAIWETVAPWLPGFSVEIVPELDSTNSELMRRARNGQCDPVLLVAERQTAGRGRLGRQWHSATGDSSQALTFSLGLALEPQQWSGLSLAAGLAIAQSLHPDLMLKWPNDIWWGQRKLAGILIETASVGAQRYVVIGVGINITLPLAADLRTPAAGLRELLPEADAAQALQKCALPLVRGVQRFAQYGWEPMQAAFHARDLLYGQEVQCSDGVTGVARGVDSQGALLVHTAGGIRQISSAEVSVRALQTATHNPN